MITVAEAKQELREYRDNIKYLQEKQDDIEELRDLLSRTTTRLSPTKTSNNSMSTDKFSDGLDRISELEKISDKKLEELLIKKFIIDDKIEKLKYPNRDILFMRYSRCKSWEDIASVLSYTRRYVLKLHGEALIEYANL